MFSILRLINLSSTFFCETTSNEEGMRDGDKQMSDYGDKIKLNDGC